MGIAYSAPAAPLCPSAVLSCYHFRPKDSASNRCTRCWQAIADSHTPASGRNVAATHLSSPEIGNGLRWPKPQCTCNAMVTSQTQHSTNEGVLRSNSACSMLISDDLWLPRRGIEPRPSGFRDIDSTSRPSPLPIVDNDCRAYKSFKGRVLKAETLARCKPKHNSLCRRKRT